MNRREALSAGAAALGLGFFSTRSPASEKSPVARIGHITDCHIHAGNKAVEGVTAMFKHMFARMDKPDLVLNTGDTVLHVDGKATAADAAAYIAAWKEAAKACPVPIHCCLGNHDIWDGASPSADIPVDLKGAALMVKTLGLPAPWYSFDHAGWHVIALNSLADWPKYGYLGKEQFDWLKDDLKKTKSTTPVCVLSHLPIMGVTAVTYADECRKGNDNVIPGTWHHADAWSISEVFRRHPNVKLCLSGHMHTQDRCEYRGVWYVCGGAVSGSWWAGSQFGFPPCYGLISLYADGAFDYEFIDYNWTAKQWKGKQMPA